jgi:hypothetical protein
MKSLPTSAVSAVAGSKAILSSCWKPKISGPSAKFARISQVPIKVPIEARIGKRKTDPNP